jgi:predicted Zn-dependent protease
VSAAAGRRRRRPWFAVATLVAATTALTVGFARRPRLPPMKLIATANEALDRTDLPAVRATIRSLDGRGAAEAADLIRIRLLLARGYVQPALDALGALAPARDGEPRGLVSLRALVAGEAALRAGQVAEARMLLAGAVAADPAAVSPHRLLATIAYDTGAIPEALGHLEAVRRLVPSDPRPVRLLALIHSDYERYADAVAYYEESLERDPDQPDRDDLLAEMAACQVQLRRHEEALATLARGVGGTRERLLEAECRLALGETAAARALVDGILAERPDDPAALVLAATIRLEDGDAPAALGPLDEAVRLAPHDYQTRLTQARALATLGRDADAARAQAEAERIRRVRAEFAELHQQAWDAPRDPAVRLRLAEVAESLGRPDLARVWREAAAALAGK